MRPFTHFWRSVSGSPSAVACRSHSSRQAVLSASVQDWAARSSASPAGPALAVSEAFPPASRGNVEYGGKGCCCRVVPPASPPRPASRRPAPVRGWPQGRGLHRRMEPRCFGLANISHLLAPQRWQNVQFQQPFILRNRARLFVRPGVLGKVARGERVQVRSGLRFIPLARRVLAVACVDDP